MAAVTELARPDFVVDQLDALMTIPPFAGDAFSAMENGNARRSIAAADGMLA
jgi:hypothetical protein